MIRNITTNNPATKNKHRPHNKNTNSKNLKKYEFWCKNKSNQQVNDFKKLKSSLWTVGYY